MTHEPNQTRVKLRVPAACRGISVGGEALPITADGSLHTDAATAAALEAHGAVPWHEPHSVDVTTAERDVLIELFVTRTRTALADQDTETIRASLCEDGDEPQPTVTRDDIAQMNRASVLAYLQARAVDVPSSASLTDLRARAVGTLDA